MFLAFHAVRFRGWKEHNQASSQRYIRLAKSLVKCKYFFLLRVMSRNDLDVLLTCFRYKALAKRKTVRTTNAIERRFREVRRRVRPMGAFQDITSMDRILLAAFVHENKSQGIATPFLLRQNN